MRHASVPQLTAQGPHPVDLQHGVSRQLLVLEQLGGEALQGFKRRELTPAEGKEDAAAQVTAGAVHWLLPNHSHVRPQSTLCESTCGMHICMHMQLSASGLHKLGLSLGITCSCTTYMTVSGSRRFFTRAASLDCTADTPTLMLKQQQLTLHHVGDNYIAQPRPTLL